MKDKHDKDLKVGDTIGVLTTITAVHEGDAGKGVPDKVSFNIDGASLTVAASKVELVAEPGPPDKAAGG